MGMWLMVERWQGRNWERYLAEAGAAKK